MFFTTITIHSIIFKSFTILILIFFNGRIAYMRWFFSVCAVSCFFVRWLWDASYIRYEQPNFSFQFYFRKEKENKFFQGDEMRLTLFCSHPKRSVFIFLCINQDIQLRTNETKRNEWVSGCVMVFGLGCKCKWNDDECSDSMTLLYVNPILEWVCDVLILRSY